MHDNSSGWSTLEREKMSKDGDKIKKIKSEKPNGAYYEESLAPLTALDFILKIIIVYLLSETISQNPATYK